MRMNQRLGLQTAAANNGWQQLNAPSMNIFFRGSETVVVSFGPDNTLNENSCLTSVLLENGVMRDVWEDCDAFAAARSALHSSSRDT